MPPIKPIIDQGRHAAGEGAANHRTRAAMARAAPGARGDTAAGAARSGHGWKRVGLAAFRAMPWTAPRARLPTRLTLDAVRHRLVNAGTTTNTVVVVLAALVVVVATPGSAAKAAVAFNHQKFCAAVQAGALPARTVSVRDPRFAAGGPDDLARMRAAAAYLPDHPGTTLVYPQGVYRIDQTWTWPEQSQDLAAQGVLYDGLRNVKVVGCGAHIEVKGDFHKTAVQVGGNNWASREGQISPFLIGNSSNFLIQGFEIDGNAYQMTLDPQINNEIPDIGVKTFDAHNYQLADLYVHNFATDGVLLGAGAIDYRFSVDHVESANNGRDALSLIQVRNATITRSVFRDAGNSGASVRWPDGTLTPFRGFSPEAGVAIEPDCVLEPVPNCPGFVHKGGNLLFDAIRVLDNAGNGFSSAHFATIQNVTVRRSYVKNPPDSSAFAVVLLDGVMERSKIRAERGPIILSGFDAGGTAAVAFRRNKVRGGNLVLQADGVSASVRVTGNQFIGDFHGGPADLYMMLVQDEHTQGPRTWRFTDNLVEIPDNAQAPDYRNSFIALGRLRASTGNTFRSVAAADPSSPGTTPWLLSYGLTQTIDDRLTRPDGLVPYNNQPHLEACVDSVGRLRYVEGASTCAQ